MAKMKDFYQTEAFKEVAKNLKEILRTYRIRPGDTIWAIRSACYNCPNYDDHCGIDCKKKEKRYLEKTAVKKVTMVVEQENNGLEFGDVSIKFTDIDDNEYSILNMCNDVFANREEALEAL